MKGPFACVSVAALVCGAALCQSTEPAAKFEAAEILPSPPSISPYPRGPFRQGVRYELKNASVVNMISTAYGVEADKVEGGPSWIDFDRFDITAKVAADVAAEQIKLMLQALLADRFQLTFHSEMRPFPAYELTVGKNVKLKESQGGAAGPGPVGGCGFRVNNPGGPGPATPAVMPPTMTLIAQCNGITMASLANSLRGFVGSGGFGSSPPQIIDKTDLKGVYDIEYRFSMANGMADSAKPIEDALDQQLGLKLAETKVPMQVILVDKVNRKPTGNSPDVEKSLPPLPAEFDVVSLKASPPPQPGAGRGGRGPAYQNDRVNLQGLNLRQLIYQAWNIGNGTMMILNGVVTVSNSDLVVGIPKWADTDRYDVMAKVPAEIAIVSTGGRGMGDPDIYRPMLQKLLIDRFQMKVHYEDRPVNAYVLSAVKPKLQKADPADRTKWIEGPGPDEKDPRKSNPAAARLVHCQNMTMAQFAALLPSMASGYLQTPVEDATGLEGGWNFTINFSGAGLVNGMGGRGGGDPSQTQASDPSGGISLSDAISKQLGLKLEQQKRPIKVLVIDHMEQRPTEN